MSSHLGPKMLTFEQWARFLFIKDLEGWEFFYFKFGMMLLLCWLNYHVFDAADDTRVYVPMGFKGKFFCCYLYMILCGKCSSGVVVVCWDREGRKGKD